jgi:hypothetical protein
VVSRPALGVGICISADRVTASGVGGRGGWQAELEGLDGAQWPSLEAALKALASLAGSTTRSLHVALAAPLIELRPITLPPLDDGAMQTLLSRHAGRYFLGARGPQVIGARRDPRAEKGESVVLAAAASTRVVTAIESAAHGAGWQVAGIVPMEAALAAAVGTRDGGALFVLAVHGTGGMDALHVADGALRGVRRLRSGAVDVELVGTLAAGQRIHLAGAADPALTAALADRGLTAVRGTDAGEELARIAARGAPLCPGPILVSDDVRAARTARAASTARWLWGSAAALLIAAAGLERWGVERELQAVSTERASLKPKLGSTLVGRSTVETAYRRLADLQIAERSSPQWSRVIATLATDLPEGAFMTTFRGRGDSLVVDGLAERAAGVFESLERSKAFAGARSAAPVRREIQDGGEALEHYTIALRLAGLPPVTGGSRSTGAPAGARPGAAGVGGAR